MILRKDVKKDEKWDLKTLIKSEEEFSLLMDETVKLKNDFIKEFKGKINNANTIVKSLEKYEDIEINLGQMSSYRFLKVSVDQTNLDAQGKLMKDKSKINNIIKEIGFLEFEILQNSDETINEAIKAAPKFKSFLNKIIRKKEYSLGFETENAIKVLAPVLDSPMSLYNSAKLQDLDFEDFTLDGKSYPLSFVLFENEYEFETNHKVRHKAFYSFSENLRKYQNVIANAYTVQVKKEKALADIRGFDSVINYLLFDQEIDRKVYDEHIDIIYNELSGHMRKYARIIKEEYKLDKVTFKDLKLPLDPDFEPEITPMEAKEQIKEGLSILGDSYIDMVDRAFDERWIDFSQNKGKSTGAFCASPYGSHPFILINWTKRMREVFVLSHELGHAGHFYTSQKNQNLFSSRPSLYFIEAPSTMNEMIMANHMLKQDKDKRFKRWLLGTMISRTYYHNFVTHMLEAYFQREVYKRVDEGEVLHAEIYNKIKRETLEGFWGDDVIIDEGAELTWMRQQHYYKGLYPYTYSAGLSIATEVSRKIFQEDENYIEKWKDVLKAGGSKSPKELAQMVDVDIESHEAIHNTIKYIGEIIDEIDTIKL